MYTSGGTAGTVVPVVWDSGNAIKHAATGSGVVIHIVVMSSVPDLLLQFTGRSIVYTLGTILTLYQ